MYYLHGSRADSRFVPSQWETARYFVTMCLTLAWHKPAILACGSNVVSGSRVKTRGQCYSLDHDCDLVPAGLLVYWTMTDLVPAGLVVFNTGELTQVEASRRWVHVLDICTTGLVMGPNRVIHYKVVSAEGGNSLVLACEREWDLGVFFFSLGKFLSCFGWNSCGLFIWYLYFSILWLFLLIFIQWFVIIDYWE